MHEMQILMASYQSPFRVNNDIFVNEGVTIGSLQAYAAANAPALLLSTYAKKVVCCMPKTAWQFRATF